MKKIIAIGGGEIGRAGYPVETTEIDREIINLTGKESPKLLFLPTASSDAAGYVEDVRSHFGGTLGCQVDVLLLLDHKLTKLEMAEKIMGSDIIYVGGGNTLLLMDTWRRCGADQLLHAAYDQGTVMAGLSAGSICWFQSGMSDALKSQNEEAGYIKVAGLGMIEALHCPHYDFEKERPEALKKMMEKTPGIAIALENCAALEMVDDRYRLIVSRPGAKGYAIYYEKGAYYKSEIRPAEAYRPLSELLRP